MENERADPRREATRAEHDEMLKSIAAEKGKVVSPLLGPDGKPILKDAGGKPVSGGLTEEADREREKEERLRLYRKEMADKLNAKMDSDEEFKRVSGNFLAAWRLLFWLSNESLTFEGVSREMINHLSDACRASALNHGYGLDELLSVVKSKVVPYMTERLQYYRQKQNARMAQIRQIEARIGKNGVALPCHSMRNLFRNKKGDIVGLLPSGVMIVHGAAEAVRLALDACAKSHKKGNDGSSWYLCGCAEAESRHAQHDHVTYMPLSWWSGKGSHYANFEEVLEPVVKSRSILVLVERLNAFCPAAEKPEDIVRNRSRSLACVLQWANENLTCVIVGDVVEEGMETPPKAYGPIPHCAVSFKEVGGEKKLCIGNDILEE